MIENPTQSHNSLILNVAERYQRDGYRVIVEPTSADLPFGLGTYRPDLLVSKAGNEGYIVEIKNSYRQTSIDRYREVAKSVSEHEGWRFLLVTGDDTSVNEPIILPSWDDLSQRVKRSEHLVKLGEVDTAFLSFWTILEALMRKQAKNVSIPIERFPTQSLIKHLYSHGELSVEHFDMAISLLNTRNRLAHGFQAQNLSVAVMNLQKLVMDLLKLWESEEI